MVWSRLLQIASILTQHSVPWAMVFGNHDDLPFVNKTYQATSPGISREQLVSFDRMYELSYT